MSTGNLGVKIIKTISASLIGMSLKNIIRLKILLMYIPFLWQKTENAAFNKKADYYLSSTFYTQNKVARSFDEVKYNSGAAIVLKTKDNRVKMRLRNLFERADWTKYSSLATNSCYHIGKSHIYNLLFDNGFKE
jgi:hypothetical protein